MLVFCSSWDRGIREHIYDFLNLFLWNKNNRVFCAAICVTKFSTLIKYKCALCVYVYVFLYSYHKNIVFRVGGHPYVFYSPKSDRVALSVYHLPWREVSIFVKHVMRIRNWKSKIQTQRVFVAICRNVVSPRMYTYNFGIIFHCRFRQDVGRSDPGRW